MMDTREELIEAIAEALWQNESERATDRRRRIRWEDEGEGDKSRFRGYAASALAAIEDAGCRAVPVELTTAMIDARAGVRVSWETHWAGNTRAQVNRAFAVTEHSAMLAASPFAPDHTTKNTTTDK